MDNRQDAVVGAAKMVLEVQRIGRESKTGMATVSLFKSSPEIFCNIPSIVDFSFSMQHTDLDTLEGLDEQIHRFVHETAASSGMEVSNYQHIWSFDPGVFDDTAIICVEEAVKEMGYSYDKLCSHTGEYSLKRVERDVLTEMGHDSIYTQMVCPTATIFASCRNGISHSRFEYASPKTCRVLGAVLRYDEILRKKYSA